MESRKRSSLVIEADPDVLGGKLVIVGTRIPVSIIVDMIGLGYTADQIVEQYPTLTRAIIKDVIMALLESGSSREDPRQERLREFVKHVDRHE